MRTWTATSEQQQESRDLTASRGNSGPGWSWQRRAHQDEPYGYGTLGPVGPLAVTRCPATVLKGRPQLREVKGWKSWQRAFPPPEHCLLTPWLALICSGPE